MQQSQKMEAIGQLTGGIAPLGQGQLDDAQRYIGFARDSTRRAAVLTRRLLAFSRRQTLDPQPTDVDRLVRGIDELVRRTVRPPIQVKVIAPDGLWNTRIDAPNSKARG